MFIHFRYLSPPLLHPASQLNPHSRTRTAPVHAYQARGLPMGVLLDHGPKTKTRVSSSGGLHCIHGEFCQLAREEKRFIPARYVVPRTALS